ncbi:vWA domain-containing protein [Luteococcus sp. Sow4_B9]|uniref:vWA domain-containing protein n=1 Tax=Luteococcus sp. Sow4_B9 TaxID=3438792 RepID=UPI003F9EAD2C
MEALPRTARSTARRLLVVVTAATLALTATACDDEGPGGGGDAGGAAADKSLTIVAGSEQRSVLDRIVLPWCDSKGYSCTYTLKGSVDQARMLQGNSTEHDAYWFASSVFSQLGNTNSQLTDAKPMFLTPVVYAGFKPVMQELGMVGKDQTAAQIIQSVESGKATVWATNPTQSNSGATTLFSFLNHFAGNPPGQALTQEQLKDPKVVKGMQTFIQAIDKTPPSTGTMMDDCLASPGQCETMFTYEDLVIEKNLELVSKGEEPLYVVYPRGAMAISDAPLGFSNHGQDQVDAKHAIFTELQNYLLSDPGAKDKLLALGRRPAGGVGLSLASADPKVFNPDWGIKANLKEQGVTYPAAAVIESALDAYHTQFRKPVELFYCLDGSGSMADNEGWDGVQDAAGALFDPEQARRNLLQTAAGDTTTVAVFNGAIKAGPWTVAGNAESDLKQLESKIRDTSPGGGTDIYSCLDLAASQLGSSSGKGKQLIVVMSDGMSGTGKRDQALAKLDQAKVPVITIAFGKDADPNQLKELAQRSGGAFVQKNDMVAALREAAGYK